ncbi:30S ribosomal protein S6--L-glutamate ligase, partial [Sphingobacterium shayense]|nr:30S ribosomal protein S6--L-glutamate ligase [Sphingobacterium shayense]
LEGIEAATGKDIAIEVVKYLERQYAVKQAARPATVKRKVKKESKL